MSERSGTAWSAIDVPSTRGAVVFPVGVPEGSVLLADGLQFSVVSEERLLHPQEVKRVVDGARFKLTIDGAVRLEGPVIAFDFGGGFGPRAETARLPSMRIDGDVEALMVWDRDLGEDFASGLRVRLSFYGQFVPAVSP